MCLGCYGKYIGKTERPLISHLTDMENTIYHFSSDLQQLSQQFQLLGDMGEHCKLPN